MRWHGFRRIPAIVAFGLAIGGCAVNELEAPTKSVFQQCGGSSRDPKTCSLLMLADHDALTARLMWAFEEIEITRGRPIGIRVLPEIERGVDARGAYLESYAEIHTPEGPLNASFRFIEQDAGLRLSEFSIEAH